MAMKKAASKKGDEPVRVGKGMAQPPKSEIKKVQKLADEYFGKGNYRIVPSTKKKVPTAIEKTARSYESSRTKISVGLRQRDITNRTSGPAKKK